MLRLRVRDADDFAPVERLLLDEPLLDVLLFFVRPLADELLLLLVSCAIATFPLTFDSVKSIGVLVDKALEDLQEQNLNVQSYRPVLYIIKVTVDSFFD